MSKKLEKIRNFCAECDGEGEVSVCCQAGVHEGRCECGKFCKSDYCCYCEGNGYTEYSLGDEVDIFVCVWSEEYLQKQLYVPKEVGDTKTFTGDIVEIVDKWNVVVKIGRKKVNVKIEDLSIR